VLLAVCGVTAVVALAGGWVVKAWKGSDVAVPRASVHIATVMRGSFIRDITAEGTVVAANSPTLFSPAAGTVTFMASAGEPVTQGQILVFIENPGLKNQLARERATLDGLTGSVERETIETRRQILESQRVVDLANTQVHATEREFERMKGGLEQGVVAHRDVDKAQDARDDARVTFDHAVSNAKLLVSSLSVELKTRQTDIERQKLLVADVLRRVEALTIRSPVKGVIGSLLVNQKAAVGENAGLLTVVDLSVLDVEFGVPEAHALDIATDMAADISYAGKNYHGTVVSISPEVEQNAVRGRVRFADGSLPGMRQNQRVNVRIVLDRRDDVLTVERGAFVDTGSVAYRVVGEVATRQPLMLGATNARQAVILSGLNAGDQIIVSSLKEFGNAPQLRLTE
jgi:HlyD family secretion protein